MLQRHQEIRKKNHLSIKEYLETLAYIETDLEH
jgi:hypothetical protein